MHENDGNKQIELNSDRFSLDIITAKGRLRNCYETIARTTLHKHLWFT